MSAGLLDRRTRALVLACFCVSGATGLVYEGIWFRYLQAIFGVTTHALSVVVAAFMGGLAAGSWALGRAADRAERPLRLYGALEVGVAILAPLVPFLIRGVEHLYVALHPSMSGSLLLLSILRLVLALVTLLLPTFLMGGTLPVLTVLLRRDARARGADEALHRSLGRLYGLNTLGALGGTVLVGFVLLARLGLWRTTLLAVAANLAIGLWCLARGAREAASRLPAPGVVADLGGQGSSPGALLRFAWIAFAVSGGLSLAYEVAWTRMLAQIIGSSTYAFSMILAAFLLGIALGSLVLSGWKGRDQAGLLGFCWAELGIGVTGALVVPLLVHLPDLQLRAFRGLEQLNGVLAVQFAICLLVVLLPTFCMGATFPLLAGFVAARGGREGRDVGRLYAANTIGGIAGSMLAGFVALPVLGTQRTLQVAVVCNAVLALGGLVLVARAGAAERSTPGRAARILHLALGGASAALLLWALFTPRWDPYLLDSGLAVVGPSGAKGILHPPAADLARSSDMLYYREGLNANISVRKDETQLYLKTNGKTDGTSQGDMPTQLMLGLLPSLLHPGAHRALVIGLGTGASARAASRCKTLERLDVVEIEPAVLEASRRWFGSVNGGLFEDPRVHVSLDDARAFLLTTPERYDFVVSEPSNPWIAGVANLFSVEHYQRCAARMDRSGILSQWLQIYAMSPDLVRMVLASIRQVFPQMQIYSFRHGDLIVLASQTELPPLDLDEISQRLETWGVRDQVHEVLGIRSSAGLLGYYLLGGEDVERYASGAPSNTEDRPRLEFQAPRSLYLATSDLNSQLLRAERREFLPPVANPDALGGQALVDVARASLRARRAEDAARWLDEALKKDDLAPSAVPVTSRAEVLALSGEISLARGRADLAETSLTQALQLGSRPAAQQLAALRFRQGRAVEGLALLESACATESPDSAHDLEPCLQMLEVSLQLRRAAAARAWGETHLSLAEDEHGAPADQRARLVGLLARACFESGDSIQAKRHAERALALNAQCTSAWRVMGALEYHSGSWAEAASWWRRLVDYRQVDPDVLVPLAQAYVNLGEKDQARFYVQWTLAMQPNNTAARRLAADLR